MARRDLLVPCGARCNKGGVVPRPDGLGRADLQSGRGDAPASATLTLPTLGISLLALTVLALTVLAAPRAVYAYLFIYSEAGQPLYWPSDAFPLEWTLSSRGGGGMSADEMRPALQASFDAWQTVPCAEPRFVYAGTSDVGPERAGVLPPDHRNLLVFRDSDWPPEWNGAIAVTTPVHNPSTGRIADADIVFNGVHFAWSAGPTGERGKMDLANIATHEIGHLLGLDHPGTSNPRRADDPSRPEATMEFDAAEGEIDKRDLALDDILGLCTHYLIPDRFGAPCATERCGDTGPCIGDGPTGVRFCSAVCGSVADCPLPGFACRSNLCQTGDPVGAPGDTCLRPPDCVEPWVCVRSSASAGVCRATCLNASQCAVGQGCTAARNARGQEIGVCADVSPLLRGPHEPCRLTSQCRPGLSCLPARPESEGGGEPLCAMPCDDTQLCGPDEECLAYAVGRYCRVAQDGPELPPPATAPRAAISSLDVSPESPWAAPVRLVLRCDATAPEGADIRFWLKTQGGEWMALSEWQSAAEADALLTLPGYHSIVCRARRRGATTVFDDERAVPYRVSAPPTASSDPVKPWVGGSRGGCGGGDAVPQIWIWVMALAWTLLGRFPRRPGVIPAIPPLSPPFRLPSRR